MMKYTKKKNNTKLYLFLLPLIVVLLVMVAYPFFSNILYSFTDYSLIKPEKQFIFLDNYIKILGDNEFLSIFKNTIIWTVGNMVLIIIIGLTVGLLLDSDIKGKIILQSVILIPWVIPQIVTGYTWKWMMASDYGILNSILLKLGIIDGNFSWFRDGKMAMLAVILANVWRSFPLMAVMIYAKKRTMPKEWTEAAVIDGASTFQVFRYIVLEYVKPVLISTSILIFLWCYNAFGIIYAITEGGPLGATETFPVFIQKKAFGQFDFGFTSAMSILMMLSMLILYMMIKMLFKRRKNSGEV